MVSPFRAATAIAEADLDRHLGDTIQVTPMRATDFGRVPDPERPAFDVVALVQMDESSAVNVPKVDQRVSTEVWYVEIRRPLLAGRRIRKNDEIILLEEPGSPRVVVSNVDPGDPNRLTLVCSPIGAD